MSAAAHDNHTQPKSYVGFDTITSQIESRLLKRGFQFNIMVVGYSGLGKSTLINSLFSSRLATSSGRKNTFDPIEKTCEIKATSHSLIENGVRLNINVIDTPGFGDQINNDKCWEPIVKYIKEQHSQYLRKELTAQRERHIPDTRVHAVLYFIQPNNKGFRSLDLVALKKFSEIANVIPIIPKADSLTLNERAAFKKVIQDEIVHHNLNIYPYDSEDYVDEERQINEDIKALMPFAVVGSEREITINGKTVRGRKTRWGAIDIEDVSQSEFVYLRDFLTRTHLQDLIETTSLVHYESFRSKQLIALKENASGARSSSHMGNAANGTAPTVPVASTAAGTTYQQPA